MHFPGNIGLGSRSGRTPGSALLIGRTLRTGRLHLRLVDLRLAGIGTGRTASRRLYELYPLGVSALRTHRLHAAGLLRVGLVVAFLQPAGSRSAERRVGQ